MEKQTCLSCKFYRPDVNLCSKQWRQLEGNSPACDDYADASDIQSEKNLEGIAESDDVHQETEETNLHVITKRGSLVRGSQERKSFTFSEPDPKEKKRTEWNIYMPPFIYDHFNTICVSLLVVIVAASAFFAIKYFVDSRTKEEKEFYVYKAISVLEELSSNHSVGYLRLFKYDYVEADDVINLEYNANLSFAEINNYSTDAGMLRDLMSVIVLAQDKWKTLANILDSADVNLQVNYEITWRDRPPKVSPNGKAVSLSFIEKKDYRTFMVTHDDILSACEDNAMIRIGDSIFTERKRQEILQYANNHYLHDRFFTPDGVTIDSGYVNLTLTYDDEESRLGDAFLDTVTIDPHLLDKVGDMGGIIDGMLYLAMHNKKGVSVTYIGTKANKVDKYGWSAAEVPALNKKVGKRHFVDRQKAGRVRTVTVITVNKEEENKGQGNKDAEGTNDVNGDLESDDLENKG